MKEVEKLYELADIKFSSNGIASKGITYYYPFTAEKQLELIKWTLRTGCILEVRMEAGSNLYNCPHTEKKFGKFEEALCADINHHWKFMKLYEQEEIRKILKG